MAPFRGALIIANHAVTMAQAFHSNRYASGFALARPTLEALMKQVLLTAYVGDNDGWQKLVAQRIKVNRHSLKDLATRTGWPDLSQRWADLAPVLNDFVHGGKGQLLGNPVDEDGWPVYPGDWFWTAMFIATISMLATSGWFWAHIKDEERASSFSGFPAKDPRDGVKVWCAVPIQEQRGPAAPYTRRSEQSPV